MSVQSPIFVDSFDDNSVVIGPGTGMPLPFLSASVIILRTALALKKEFTSTAR